jgi:hypothetical protein
MTIFETIRRLWRAFARALPEYEKRNLREWTYWGTLRAKRELRSLGLEWKELTPPGEGADEKRYDHDQPGSSNGRAKVLREAHGGSHRTVKE